MNKNLDRPSRKFFQTFTYIINLFLKTVDDFFKVYKDEREKMLPPY